MPEEDPAMKKIRSEFKKSKMTLQEFGEKMDYPSEQARQGAFQFMKSSDPRISMLRRAAKALGVKMTELFE